MSFCDLPRSVEIMDSNHLPDRWTYLNHILMRPGPLSHPNFEPSAELMNFVRNDCHILVIGAGGLGCELLKNLALMGFTQIDVIDMDCVDLSNLNRQFLFRKQDVGKSKAEVAAAFINSRVPGCNVVAHNTRIESFDEDFYRQFHIVVCGLDSVVARRWINGMLVSLLRYDEDGALDESSVIPLIDGGTEGFKGNARVIYPGLTACIECTLDLYPPQVTFPLCTIAHTPRLPEHCIEYVRLLLWPQEKPFGDDTAIDGDNPDHITWIFEKATERAASFHIAGVTYRLTQGVVKRIIPAVASTNAVIAAVCCTEVFKVATRCCMNLNNYVNFSDTEGVYTYTFEAERKADCPVCSQVPQNLSFSDDNKLSDLIEHLQQNASYQLKSPGVTCTINGKSRTLYMSAVKSIEEATRPNLKKTLKELGLYSGQELYVADATTPNTLTFILKLASPMEAQS